MSLQLRSQYIVGEMAEGKTYQVYAPADVDTERKPVLEIPTECREFAYDYCHALNEARRERTALQLVGSN